MVLEILSWLYGLQRKKKQALGRTESKLNAGDAELDALQSELTYIDYLIGIMIEKLGDEHEDT